MTSEQHGLLRRLRRFLSPAEELEAEDLKARSRDCGASPLAECCDRARVKIRGTIRWVTSLDMGGVEALLTDGTGSIELNWTGRRRLDCITPGCRAGSPPVTTGASCTTLNSRSSADPTVNHRSVEWGEQRAEFALCVLTGHEQHLVHGLKGAVTFGY